MTAERVLVRVGALQIAGASPLEARRMADTLPAALERALAVALGPPGDAPPGPARGAAQRPVEQVAALVASRVALAIAGELAPAGPAVVR